MEGETEKVVEKYIHDIKMLLPICEKEERRFLEDIRSSCESLLEDNPEYTQADIYEELGTPGEIVANYYESIDANNLLKRIQIAKQIRRAVAIVLAIAIAVLGCIALIQYNNFIHGEESYAEREIFSKNHSAVDQNK